MTHDEFVRALEDVSDWSQARPALAPEAEAHRRECADCARLADALAAMALDAEAGDDAVPAGYWSAFDAAVADRVSRESARRPSQVNAPARRAPARSLRRLWPLAAAILVAALVVVAWRERRADEAVGDSASAGSQSRPSTDILATMDPDEVEAALASFGAAGFDDEDVPLDLPADLDDDSSADGASRDAALDLAGPVDGLEAELLESLSEAERTELARKLHEAAS